MRPRSLIGHLIRGGLRSSLLGTSLAGDAVESGLKPGELVSPFDVEDVTGPNKGTTLCYR